LQKLKNLVALVFAAAVNKLKTEPVIIRSIIAGALAFLVAAGIIDTGLSETLEAVLTGLVDVLIVGSARQVVIPTAHADAVAADLATVVDPAP
jgi:hypothetical protein